MAIAKLFRASALLALCALSTGCVAVHVAGEVAEGAVNTSAFAVKTTAKTAGAVATAPFGSNDEDRED